MPDLTAPSQKRFTTPIWARALVLIGVLISCAGTFALGRTQGTSLASVGLGVLAILMLGGLIDALLARVELHPDRLVIFSNFRKREFSRTRFTRVTWAKGAPVALELVEGGWLKLPDFVPGGPGTLSTFRSWLQGH